MLKQRKHSPDAGQLRGGVAVTLGAALWGLFWIPLRYLDDHGVHGLWAVASVTLTSAIPALLLTWRRREMADLRSPDAWLIGCALGTSVVLYFFGVMLSDVIRVILLFYLLPVWTTLAARVVYGEAIKPAQLVVIGFALLGVWLLLGGRPGWPMPTNVGDWCGLGAGMFWGVSLALLRGRQGARPVPSVSMALSVAAALASVGALAAGSVGGMAASETPSLTSLLDGMPLIVLFGALILFPAMFSQVWGAQLIPAPTAALLTMTEILVATASAWWLIGTELTWTSIAGGVVIIITVLADVALKFRWRGRSGGAGNSHAP